MSLTFGYIQKTLTSEEMLKLLKDHNAYNRPLKPELVKKYTRWIEEGKWATTHPEGNTLVLDENGSILSGQHRLKAFICARVLEHTFWICTASREKWIQYTVESRSATDKVAMQSSREFTIEELEALKTLQNQYFFLTSDSPHTSCSGGSGKNKLSPDELKSHTNKVDLFNSLIQPVRLEKQVYSACFILYATGLLKAGFETLDNSSSPLGWARNYIRNNKVKRLPDVVLIVFTASKFQSVEEASHAILGLTLGNRKQYLN